MKKLFLIAVAVMLLGCDAEPKNKDSRVTYTQDSFVPATDAASEAGVASEPTVNNTVSTTVTIIDMEERVLNSNGPVQKSIYYFYNDEFEPRAAKTTADCVDIGNYTNGEEFIIDVESTDGSLRTIKDLCVLNTLFKTSKEVTANAI